VVQSLSEKVVNNFVGGLITEAGELTFPPNASVDELNCILDRDGSRRRREGVAYEADHVLSTFVISEETLVHNGTWFNVGGIAGREYEVFQRGTTLFFYDKATQPFSGSEQAQTVNLMSYEHLGTKGAGIFKCQFSSVAGALIVTNPGMDTIVIERTEATGALVVSRIKFRTRDFTYLSDRTRLSEQIEPTDPLFTNYRRYDTENSGWPDARIATWQAARTGSYPPLSLPWFSGKDASGNFSVSEWLKIQSGSSLIGNGRYVLDFFDKNRSYPTGIADLPRTKETTRFSCITTFQNRVFYSGLSSSENSNVILFSKQLEPSLEGSFVNTSGLGDCFSVNDPTSEDFSDLLDTDGGEIRIPEAYGIKQIHPFANRLFVFATNGVWSINGVDDVFKATGYSVKKISSVGMASFDSFVSAEGIPFWWSTTGIHTLTFDKTTFEPTEQNLSVTTIQTFLDNISLRQKDTLSSVYDATNKRVYWAYPKKNETDVAKLSHILILDLNLGAFYPWEIADTSGNSSHLVGLSSYTGLSVQDSERNVVSNAGQTVLDASSNNVVVERTSGLVTGDPSIVLLVKDGATTKLTMATFTGEDFLDWGSADYSSYAETGYDFLGDLIFQKTTPYILVVCKQTETGWVGNENTGYLPTHPSSLKISTYWDFKRTGSALQEAYRIKPIPVVPADLSSFGHPATVVETRLRIKGKGRSMRIRFESVTGKDFHLLGYGLIYGRNSRH